MVDWREEDLVLGPDFEVAQEYGSHTFYLETWFDVEEKFSVAIPEGSDECLILYATYRPDSSECHAYQPTKQKKI